MKHIVDARGYSCPQPVIMTVTLIDRIKKGTIAILVDTETSKENVIRMTDSKGWELDGIETDEGDYRITVSKD